MAAHDYHGAHENYDERQILHDGCGECEYRGKHIESALAHMDRDTFARAWERAYNLKASDGDHDVVGPVADAEVDLLNVLWVVQLHLQRLGWKWLTYSPAAGRKPVPPITDADLR